jgi:hypothetical protein
VLAALHALPKTPVSVCQAHGDLHTRNIFVRRNSLDVLLIDFAGAHSIGPSSRDPATLDVMLAFDVPDRNNKFPTTPNLRVLYTPPLLPPSRLRSDAGRLDSRIEAIRRVRMHVSGEGMSTQEYEITVACCLLRFARLTDPAGTSATKTINRLKGLAYELAIGLIPGLVPAS